MKKLWLLVNIVLIVIILFTSIAGADVGPKPSLEIIVRGMDTDKYWLDLLVTDDANFSWLEITEEERKKVSKLIEYRDEDGFHPALLVGTKVPLSGDLKGEKQKDGSYLHLFGYVGVPDIFKIVILKKDGTLIISEKIERKQFQSVVEFDIKNLKTAEKIPWCNISIGFLIRLALTLLIEIFIAIMFGFTLKKSLKIILITNIITQVILNILVFSSDITGGLFAAIITFILAEIFIVIAEVIVYLNLLTQKSKLRRLIYAVSANLVSLSAGFMLLLT